MKFAVLFIPQAHGGYLARVPDIPQLEAYGRTMAATHRALHEAAGYLFGGVAMKMPQASTLCEMVELDFPQVSSVEDPHQQETSQVSG